MARVRLRLHSIAIILLAAPLVAASCEKTTRDNPPRATASKNHGEVHQMTEKKPDIHKDVFRPQVAGQFYDSNPEKLRSRIQGFLDEAKKKNHVIKGDLLGVIVPHAGYPYSGPVAAHSFELLRNHKYSRVVVLGPAHHRAFGYPALLDADAYATPLGDISIDKEAIAKLESLGAGKIDREKFYGEHALEVELPFLQVAMGDFKLVPIMLSLMPPQRAKDLAIKLKQAFPNDDTLFVASTDLSHDFPYDTARAMDKNAMSYVMSFDPDGLYKAYMAFRQAGMNITVDEKGNPKPNSAQMCGVATVLTLLQLAKQYHEPTAQVLDLRNSGDVLGDIHSRIVGYSAVAISILKPRPHIDQKPKNQNPQPEYLTEDEKKELLTIARKTLETYLEESRVENFTPKHQKLSEPGAAFVTLKKHGQLRGCIGYMEPVDPLWKMIRDRAIDAAVHDTRFNPVTADELKDIEIEISVLTPRQKVKDPLSEIKIGRDGVWIQIGLHRGVFLPQVPTEQGWTTVEQYLDHLCYKAHLPQAGCWKSPEAHIQKFQALVF